jgi:hypothetical protein
LAFGFEPDFVFLDGATDPGRDVRLLLGIHVQAKGIDSTSTFQALVWRQAWR